MGAWDRGVEQGGGGGGGAPSGSRHNQSTDFSPEGAETKPVSQPLWGRPGSAPPERIIESTYPGDESGDYFSHPTWSRDSSHLAVARWFLYYPTEIVIVPIAAPDEWYTIYAGQPGTTSFLQGLDWGRQHDWLVFSGREIDDVLGVYTLELEYGTDGKYSAAGGPVLREDGAGACHPSWSTDDSQFVMYATLGKKDPDGLYVHTLGGDTEFLMLGGSPNWKR